MNSDIKLDGGFVIFEGNWTRLETLDLMLDAPSRRRSKNGLRRALVHNHQDGLTINYNSDYPGGVSIRGKTFMEQIEVDNIHVNKIVIGPYQIKNDKNTLIIKDTLTGNTGTIKVEDIDLQKKPRVSPDASFEVKKDQLLQELRDKNSKLQKLLEQLALRVDQLEGKGND